MRGLCLEVRRAGVEECATDCVMSRLYEVGYNGTMSHRRGANWRREEGPSTRKDCPTLSCGAPSTRHLPPSIIAGGKTRVVTQYLRENARPGITAYSIVRVLDHGVIRGVRTEEGGRGSMCYMSFVPGMMEMVRVAVSMDDERIINAFPDRTATRHWNKGNTDYFARVNGDLEVRDEG